MLSVKNCTFTYPGQEEPSLRDLSVEIKPGVFLAIVGANGSGKSTMCKLFNGIIPHFFVGDLEGEIEVNGIDTRTSDVATLSEHIGYVYQDFENSIVRSTVYDEVSYAPLNYGYDDFEARALEALAILEISHLKDERIWQLSGGQKHLVALAAVLAVNPEYIIVDEPVAQLDPFHARQTYDMLKKLHEEYKKTIIVIEHHTEFIADYCTDVLLMQEGRVLWQKPVEEALRDVDALVECKIHPPQVTQLAGGFGRIKELELPTNLEQGENYFASFEQLEPEATATITETEAHQEKREKTVSIRDLNATYRDYHRAYKEVLSDITLDFYQGERIAIVGNNGAGKSTLMRLIARLMKPSNGVIMVMGQDISELSPEVVSNTVSFIYQNPEEMFIEDSIVRDVSFFLKSRKVPTVDEQVRVILDALNLTSIQEKDARLLSGGQQRRVSLAIGMGMTPQVILLDEPTGSLDISSRRELLTLLDVLKVHIKTAVIATHDMQLVADWATRVIVLAQGRVIYDGDPRGLFANVELMRAANLAAPQIVDLSNSLGMDPVCLSVSEMQQRLKPPPTNPIQQRSVRPDCLERPDWQERVERPAKPDWQERLTTDHDQRKEA